LPKLLEMRPNARVLVVGGDEVSYGRRAAEGKSWREVMLAEVPLDLSRVHFLGKLPYDQYRSVLQISSAHIYLTRPFVLSWSCIEAMSIGCLVIGSKTPPVQEVIADGVNGLSCRLPLSGRHCREDCRSARRRPGAGPAAPPCPGDGAGPLRLVQVPPRPAQARQGGGRPLGRDLHDKYPAHPEEPLSEVEAASRRTARHRPSRRAFAKLSPSSG
jgi:hypothetical protein